MSVDLINPNPVVQERRATPGNKSRRLSSLHAASACSAREPIDALEVFEHLRDITDPEHPYSLEQLAVVREELVDVDDAASRVRFAMIWSAPLLTPYQVSPGSHSTEASVNKQLGDKERVAAALENPGLLDMVNRCLANSEVG